jgi:hypothetical protein
MPYYAAMAAVGSVAGCIWIYVLARKGGQAYYRKKQQQPSGRVRKWVQKYPFTSVLLPAVAPFPVPFKPFVIAQGVFQLPFIPFVVGTFVGRAAAVFYGRFRRCPLRGDGGGICIPSKSRFPYSTCSAGRNFRGDPVVPDSSQKSAIPHTAVAVKLTHGRHSVASPRRP